MEPRWYDRPFPGWLADPDCVWFRRTDTEFKREAVRLVLSSGRPRTEIAEDLGVGLSSLTRWIGQYRGEEMPPEIRDDLQAELKRLRKENAVLRQERDILKKAAAFFAKEGSR